MRNSQIRIKNSQASATPGSTLMAPEADALRGSMTSMGLDASVIATYLADRVRYSLAGQYLPHEPLNPSGRVAYSPVTAKDAEVRGINERAEMGEYGMVEFRPSDMKEGTAGDFGGKFRVSQKALDMGDTNILLSGLDLIAAELTLDLDRMFIAALDKIAEEDPAVIYNSGGWEGVTLVGPNPTPETQRPSADLIRASRVVQRQGVGANPNVLLVSEDTSDALEILYGKGEVYDVLHVMGGSHKNAVADGVGYLLDYKTLGALFSKAGVQVDIWEDKATRSWYAQAWIEPVIVINRPRNFVKLLGLNHNIND